MGTSASSTGPGSGIPLVPPWVDGGGADGADGAPDADQDGNIDGAVYPSL
jgi:hypothetical protein